MWEDKPRGVPVPLCLPLRGCEEVDYGRSEPNPGSQFSLSKVQQPLGDSVLSGRHVDMECSADAGLSLPGEAGHRQPQEEDVGGKRARLQSTSKSGAPQEGLLVEPQTLLDELAEKGVGGSSQWW